MEPLGLFDIHSECREDVLIPTGCAYVEVLDNRYACLWCAGAVVLHAAVVLHGQAAAGHQERADGGGATCTCRDEHGPTEMRANQYIYISL